MFLLTGADALSHLARLRQQLETERERVNQALENEQVSVAADDPLLDSFAF